MGKEAHHLSFGSSTFLEIEFILRDMIFDLSSTHARRFSAMCFVLALSTFSISAQLSIVQTTNYYTVTGANFREIRQSISMARPWNDGFDGDTRWTVEWKFNSVQTAVG